MTEKENKEKYNEILRLRDMLEKAEIPFVWKEHKDYRNGYQILYPVDGVQNICSVIEHRFSYGNEKDLLEIQGLMTKEEKEKQLDTVLGFLTAENVFKRIEKHWKNRYEVQNMFEKETEEYVIKKHHIDKTKLPIDFSLRCEFSDDFTDFQKGAEFGYQKGLRAKINTTTISDCPINDSWHKQSTDDIYDFIAKDWSIIYFICIMKDKSLVTATGSCDESCSGEVSANLVFDYDDEKYSSEDIVWWKEIELPEEN